MQSTHYAMLRRYLAPPAPARTSSEKALYASARAHTITWFDIAIGLAVLGNLALSLLDVYTCWWYIGYVDVGLSLYLLLLLAAKNFKPLLGRLLLLGIIAGICELFTDASGEYVVHSLIYPSGEPMLWASPVYMPLSWLVVLTPLGYIAWRLQALLGRGKTLLICGIWGAIQIPLFEEMAYYGGWWRYRPTPLMLGHTPAYVLLFEGLVGVALVPLCTYLERRSWPQVAGLGIVLGAWLPWAALIAWLLLAF